MRRRPPSHGHSELRKHIKAATLAGKSLRKYLEDEKIQKNKKDKKV